MMIEKLRPENLSLHGYLIAEKTDHARALLDIVRLQRDMKKVVKEKVETAQLLAAEQAKQENSPVAEQLKKDVLAVTMKPRNRLVL